MEIILGIGISVLLFSIGATAVIAGALLLLRFEPLRRVSFPWLLVIVHSAILMVCMALYPTEVFSPDIPFDDVYTAYYFVPGPCIYLLGFRVAHLLWPWIQTVLSYHTGSIVCMVLIPGVVGLLGGAAQWYVIGWLLQRFGLTMRLSALAARLSTRLSRRSP